MIPPSKRVVILDTYSKRKLRRWLDILCDSCDFDEIPSTSTAAKSAATASRQPVVSRHKLHDLLRLTSIVLHKPTALQSAPPSPSHLAVTSFSTLISRSLTRIDQSDASSLDSHSAQNTAPETSTATSGLAIAGRADAASVSSLDMYSERLNTLFRSKARNGNAAAGRLSTSPPPPPPPPPQMDENYVKLDECLSGLEAELAKQAASQQLPAAGLQYVQLEVASSSGGGCVFATAADDDDDDDDESDTVSTSVLHTPSNDHHQLHTSHPHVMETANGINRRIGIERKVSSNTTASHETPSDYTNWDAQRTLALKHTLVNAKLNRFN